MIAVKRSLRRHRAVAVSMLLFALPQGQASADERGQAAYRQPAAAVTRAFDRSPQPLAEVAPGRRFVLLVHPHPMPSVEQLASGVMPEHLQWFPYRELRLTNLHDGTGVSIDPVVPARLGYPRWAPDGKRFLFAAAQDAGEPSLWVGDLRGHVRRLTVAGLRVGRGHACQWMPDGRRLICVLVAGDGARSAGRPVGPRVLDTHAAAGEPGFPRSLGQGTRDVSVTTTPWAQLALVHVDADRVVTLGPKAPIARVQPSPDGRYLLVWTRDENRNQHLEVWPTGREAVPVLSTALEGRRLARWQETAPSTLCWIEATGERGGAGGDRVIVHRAPFEAEPFERIRARGRITGLKWIVSGGRMLITEYRADDGQRLSWLVTPGSEPPGRLLWSENVDSVYDDPGVPLPSPAGGNAVIAERDGAIYLTGVGATPGGSQPFLDRMDLETGQRHRLWRSAPGRHERVEALMAADASVVLTSQESPERPRTFQALRLADGAGLRVGQEAGGGSPRPFTTQVLRYTREDGTQLSATLYLPSRRKSDERLPLVLEAYPRTYRQPASTGEVRVALNRYPVLRRLSTLPLVLRGYAVLRNVAMPVVGEPGFANDSFVEQVLSNARAAVEAAVSTGFADPGRVGVFGHSYGAFMVATLLAHSDLFRAGVAASGAYNRTLTPFGFQTERRTLWQASQTYLRMSPFLAADRIDEPLLLLHGARDRNPGTPPEQSRQMFRAVRENGGTARLVVLPFEGHVFRARESVLHATAEMIDWFDHHLPGPAEDEGSSRLRVARGSEASR